ncbi:MAG: hypothetical protein HQK65_20655 [Desulfamplus sp.]|nr:hypothetical protein [Desulfamplus sp.]
MQSVQITQAVLSTQAVQNAQAVQVAQAVQNAQATQNAQTIQSTQAIQGVQAAQGVQQGVQTAPGGGANIQDGVQQALQGMQDIHDIKPPVQVGIDPVIFKIAFAILAVILLAVAGYLLFRYIKKRMNKNTKDNMPLLPPPLPADQAALRELYAISDLMLTEPRLYYFRLTALLKTFVGKIFTINAPEMTTQEIITALNTLDIEKAMTRAAKEFFLSSSMVKYAAVTPEMENMKSDEKFVKSFIDSVMSKRAMDDIAENNTSISMDNSVNAEVSGAKLMKASTISINKISQGSEK